MPHKFIPHSHGPVKAITLIFTLDPQADREHLYSKFRNTIRHYSFLHNVRFIFVLVMSICYRNYRDVQGWAPPLAKKATSLIQ